MKNSIQQAVEEVESLAILIKDSEEQIKTGIFEEGSTEEDHRELLRERKECLSKVLETIRRSYC
jgi:hypothetical protein